MPETFRFDKTILQHYGLLKKFVTLQMEATNFFKSPYQNIEACLAVY